MDVSKEARRKEWRGLWDCRRKSQLVNTMLTFGQSNIDLKTLQEYDATYGSLAVESESKWRREIMTAGSQCLNTLLWGL